MIKQSERNYWLDLFTGQTWQEFLDAGGNVTGFRKKRWKTVQRIKKGDYLVCYITGISRFIGILEVTSDAFQDTTKIWKFDDFPSRLKVKPVLALTPATAIPVKSMWGKLSILQDKQKWGVYFRGSPAKWKRQDGEAIWKAFDEAKENPINRPVDKAKFLRKPVGFAARTGVVTVPEPDPTAAEPTSKSTEHTQIQWLLLGSV